jgi:hypothetical protein
MDKDWVGGSVAFLKNKWDMKKYYSPNSLF